MQPNAQSDAASPVLILKNGKHVMPDGRVVSRDVVVPQPAAQMHRDVVSGRAASHALDRIHRKIGDLPETPDKMNALCAVMSYTAIGLDDEDIATAVGATTAQIAALKGSDAYKQLVAMFDRTVFEDAKQNARHIVARAADKAAQTMVSLLDSSDESIQAVASRELMKAADISLEDSVTKLRGGLKIVIERASEKDNKITIKVGGEHA